jgi:hypothetical protein
VDIGEWQHLLDVIDGHMLLFTSLDYRQTGGIWTSFIRIQCWDLILKREIGSLTYPNLSTNLLSVLNHESCARSKLDQNGAITYAFHCPNSNAPPHVSQ